MNRHARDDRHRDIEGIDRDTPENVRVGLAEIWCGLLGLDSVPEHESFLRLGSDSMTAMKLGARILDRFGVELPPGRLLALDTLEHQVEAITAAPRAAPYPGGSPSEKNRFPLSRAQRLFWRAQQLRAEQPPNPHFMAYKLDGLLERDKLEEAVARIIARQSMLRTEFHESGETAYE